MRFMYPKRGKKKRANMGMITLQAVIAAWVEKSTTAWNSVVVVNKTASKWHNNDNYDKMPP